MKYRYSWKLLFFAGYLLGFFNAAAMPDQEPRLGNIKVLLMFANVNGTPNTAEQSRRDAWAADTRSYYLYCSYGRCALEFTQTPTLDVNAGSVNQLTSNMRQASAAAGLNPNDYEILVYNFPASEAGNIGGGAVASRNRIIFPGRFESSGIIHEMGHALGVGHPRTIEAGSVVYPNQQGNQFAGVEAPYNMMGSGAGVGSGSGNWNNRNNLTTWNLPQKYKVGWINASELHDARSSGIYRIYSNDIAGQLVSGRRYGARIQLGISRRFDPGTQTPNIFISYQAANTYRSEEAARGVAIEMLNREITFLLDATPNSVPLLQTVTSTHPESDFGDITDSYLTVGKSVELPSLGYTISAVRTGGSGDDAWIDIRVDESRTADALPPSLAILNAVEGIPRSSDTSSELPVAQLSILGTSADPSHLSLSGPNSNLFRLNGTRLQLRAGISLPSLGQIRVNVTLDDPGFPGTEDSVDFVTPLTDDALLAATDLPVGGNGLKFLTYAATSQEIPARLPAVINETTLSDVVIPPRTVFTRHGYEWSGFLAIPSDGLYRFHSTNSFHGRLYVDGRLAIDTNSDQGSDIEAGDVVSPPVPLRAGNHFFRYVWFGNNRNNLSLNLEWQGPSIPRQRIPTDVYFLNNTGVNPDPGPSIGSQRDRSLAIDLADIVGGGDGSFPGTARVASIVGRGQIAFRTNSSSLIDGTFIPMASGNTRISSTNLVADFSSVNSAQVAGNQISNGYRRQSRISDRVINGVAIPDLSNTDSHSVLDLHSSQGITFDLDRIKAANEDGEIVRFNAAVVSPTGWSTSYSILLDGREMASGSLTGVDAASVDFAIPGNARFLTLVSGDARTGSVSNRHSVFVNPLLIQEKEALPSGTPPEVKSFNIDGSDISFQIQSQAGERYRLFGASDLKGPWEHVKNLDAIEGNGQMMNIRADNVVSAAGLRHFYRLAFEEELQEQELWSCSQCLDGSGH